MRLYVMCLGYCRVDRGKILTPGIGDGEEVLIPVPAYLIETGKERIVIDTGMHPVHIDDPKHTFRGHPLEDAIVPQMTHEDTIGHRLGEIGYSIDDVTCVINSHLHFDHCGQNDAFAGRPIIVQRRHFEIALEAPAFPNEYFERPELSYEMIDGELEIFPGVRCLITPGHAPFHQSFLVELPQSGTKLLAIDAIYTRHNLESDAWGSQADPVAARQSAHRLAEVAAAEGAELIFGHDPGQWQTLRHAPQFYE